MLSAPGPVKAARVWLFYNSAGFMSQLTAP
jgi:hypothetical protein